jgi:hypothetical protein
MEFEESAEQGFEPAEEFFGELPLVVWLRGDEPYIEEFDTDAEGAMEALGIKRSRLTQISGRELRVGRIRAGRYIKPLYRSIDLQAYKEWTRAPSSHQKSAAIVENTIEKWQEAFADVRAVIDFKLEQLKSEVHELSGQGQKISAESRSLIVTRVREVERGLKQLFGYVGEVANSDALRGQELLGKIVFQNHLVAELGKQLEILLKDLPKAQLRFADLKTQIYDVGARLDQWFAAASHGLSKVSVAVHTLAARQFDFQERLAVLQTSPRASFNASGRQRYQTRTRF